MGQRFTLTRINLNEDFKTDSWVSKKSISAIWLSKQHIEATAAIIVKIAGVWWIRNFHQQQQNRPANIITIKGGTMLQHILRAISKCTPSIDPAAAAIIIIIIAGRAHHPSSNVNHFPLQLGLLMQELCDVDSLSVGLIEASGVNGGRRGIVSYPHPKKKTRRTHKHSSTLVRFFFPKTTCNIKSREAKQHKPL